MVKRFEEWMRKYKVLEKYYNTHGNIDLPCNYTVDNINYYSWIHNMRRQYKNGQLDQIKIDLLEKLDINWEGFRGKWNANFAIAQKYYKVYGNLNVPENFIYEGINLSKWLITQRSMKQRKMLSQEKVAALDSIGMIWSLAEDKWNIKYNLAKQYYEKYGNLRISELYTIDGVNLGTWIKHLRNIKDKLLEDKIKALDDIGMIWNLNTKPKQSWDKSYKMLTEYYNTYGNSDVPFGYKVADFSLGGWLNAQRQLYIQGKLKQERIDKLNDLHVKWNPMFSKCFDKKLTAKKLSLIRSKLELHLYRQLNNLNQDEKFSDSDVLQKVDEIIIRKLQ